MRLKDENKSLWYGEPDTPAPDKLVQPGKEIPITIGVKPIDPSNEVEVRYSVNDGSIKKTVAARWLRNNPSRQAQYFRALLGPFREGETVEYAVFCRCAGERLPATEDARQLTSSFRVAEAEHARRPEVSSDKRHSPTERAERKDDADEKPEKEKNAVKSSPEERRKDDKKIPVASDKDKRNGKPINEASQQAARKPMGGSSIFESSLGLRPHAQHEATPAQSDQINPTLEETAASMSSSGHDSENGKTVPYQSLHGDETLEVEFSEMEEEYEALSYNLKTPEKTFQVRGKLVGSHGEEFIGYRIAVSFRHEAIMQYEDEVETISASGEEQIQVSPDGSFTLCLPDKSKLGSALTIKVLGLGGEILQQEEISPAQLKGELRLEVEPKKRRKIKPRDGREIREQGKFHGQAIDLNGICKVAYKQVFMWARLQDAAPEDFQLVFSARTDSQGYFFGEYPHGKFAEAYGVVAVGDKEKVPVHLKKETGVEKYGVFPHKVILGITMPEAKTADEDCSCKAVVPRHPDSEDLVNSPETYSVDIGSNGCVNFTAPNRTLEEFSFYSVVRSTDPEIKAFHLPEPGKLPDKLREKLASLGKGEEARKKREELLNRYRKTEKARFKSQQKKHPGRGPLNTRNAIPWDSEDGMPGFYQATTIAHGHLLHFKQIWKADGYSLGDLLYSLPLAPCQKKQIAIVDWQRREKSEREERQKAGDEMEAQLSRDRDISEIVKSALSEEMEGGSSARTGSVGGGIGGAFGGIVGGVSGGYSTSSSEAWQESARNLAASSLQQLSDKTRQSASSLRSQRSTVVQTVGQKEDVEVTTEVIANHNHCHAMTVEYFEVLRHFCVEQRLAEVQECLFVPLLMSRFDFAKAQRWRDTLSHVLRTDKKDKRNKGFSAIDRILDNYRGSDLPEGRYSEEAIEYLYGDFEISLYFEPPRDDKDGNFIPKNWEEVAHFLGSTPREVFQQHLEFTGGRTGETFFGFKITGYAEQWADKKVGERHQMFQNRIAPWLARGVLEKMQVVLVHKKGNTEVKLDLTLVSEYEPGRPLRVSARLLGKLPNISRESVLAVKISLPDAPLPVSSSVMFRKGTLRYHTKYMSHTLYDDLPINQNLDHGNPVYLYTPLDQEERRDPREEDHRIAHALIEHLNEHLVFYHLQLFHNIKHQQLFMLLDGFEIVVSDGERRTRRSLASVVVHHPIGYVGNSVVIPLAPGYHLDPNFEVEGNEAVDLFSYYAPTTPVPPMRISVPTPGVYAEAVMGKCNSCEVKDDTRFWRWEESPCGDEPTAIQAPSTESRRAEPPSLAPTPLAQPIISMQTAPEAPAPTGLASAMQLLGTPNLFKDITGLDLNQQNAMSALSASLETAKSFGNMAFQLEQQKQANQAQLEQQKAAGQTQLAQQSASSSNLNNQLQQIQQAQKDGRLTPEQASELTRQALSRDIGMTPTTGGDQGASSGSTENQQTDDGTLKDEPSSGDATAHTGQVPKCEEIKTSGPNDYERKDVKLFTQPTPNTCWAAAATMLISWRDKELDSIEKVMEKADQQSKAGQKYLEKFKKKDERISGSEKPDFLAALGLKTEPPACYTPQFFLDLLKNYGPVWITTDEKEGEPFSAHARIVIGIFGDLTLDGTKTKLKILDPDPDSSQGQCYTETYSEFDKKYLSVAEEDMKAGRECRAQIVHLPLSDKNTGDGGEGGGGNVPSDHQVLYRTKTTLPMLGEQYELMKVRDPQNDKFYELALDVQGRQVDFAKALERESQAHSAKYGKIHPVLYEEMERRQDWEKIPVALWIFVDEEEVDKNEYLRDDVNDDNPPAPLIAYRQQVTEAKNQVRSLLENKLGIQVESELVTVPTMYLQVTKPQIQAIASFDEVTGIYYHDTERINCLANSMAISGADNAANTYGLRGANIKIGIWELSSPDNKNKSVVTEFYDKANPNPDPHASLVSAIIKNRQQGGPHGYAPDSEIFFANNGKDEAVEWAVIKKKCSVINVSMGIKKSSKTTSLNHDDLILDYLSTHEPFPTIIKSAGNDGPNGYPTGKGFNTIKVGAHNQMATSMLADSSYKNPNPEITDRELPEIK